MLSTVEKLTQQSSIEAVSGCPRLISAPGAQLSFRLIIIVSVKINLKLIFDNHWKQWTSLTVHIKSKYDNKNWKVKK